MEINNEKNQELGNAILKTLVYFDMFDYPMSATEIWKWLYIRNEKTKIKDEIFLFADVKRELADSNYLKSKVESQSGFYYLKGREELIEKRRERHLIAQPRWKKLKRINSLLQSIPFIQTISACNTLAIHDIKPTSDIDVFIIIKTGRIWTTRFLTTLLVGILGQWRHRDHIAKKICLSFYITDDNLDLKQIEKDPYDIYLYYWIAMVSPLLDRGGYKRFLSGNTWVNNNVNNIYGYKPIDQERKVERNKLLDGFRLLMEKLLGGGFGNNVEKWLRWYQMKKMDRNKLTVAKEKTSDVIISDQMLKFHEVDKRNYFREKFEQHLREVVA